MNKFLNTAEEVSFQSFPCSVASTFRRSLILSFSCSVVPSFRRSCLWSPKKKIWNFSELKIPSKMDSPPLFTGACPQNHVRFFQKKKTFFSSFPLPATPIFLSKFSMFELPQPQNKRVGHIGSGRSSTFIPCGGGGAARNKIWCKPKVVPIKGY